MVFVEKVNKRILIFSTAYYPFVGGAEVAIKEITDRVQDVEFDLITAKMDKSLPFREKVGNVNVYRLGIGVPLIDKLILPFEGAIFARHLQKKHTYTACWCMMVTFASGAAYLSNIFSKILGIKKVPVILTLQEGDSEKYLKTKWFGLIDLSWKLALKRTTTLTVISNYLGERAKKLGYKGDIKFIPNGVDIKKFDISISEVDRKEIRESWGLREGDVALVTSSRLVVKNGVGDVIKALHQLPENIKFIIFGTGELEESLKKLTYEFAVSERVLFKGFVSHDDLPKFIKSADIFIRPSISEGMGNSFIEAFVAKVPVVTTPVGGIVDFLKDPTSHHQDELRGASAQTGYFCQPEDPQSIAKTIQRVLADPKKEEIINNAYKLAVENYNWDNLVLKMQEVFKGLLTEDKNANQPLRVLLVAGIFPPEIGGPATYAEAMVRDLPKMGIEVSVLPFRDVRSWPKFLRHIVFIFKIINRSIFPKEKIDVVFVQDTLSTGLPAILASFITRKKIVLRCPGDYVWEQAVQRFGAKENIDDFQIKKYGFIVEFMKFWQKFTIRHADIVFAPSFYFSKLVSSWNRGKKEIRTIYNGIDLNFEIEKGKYDTPTIITAGRLVTWKGIDMLVKLLVDLPEWRLIVAGDGPEKENLIKVAEAFSVLSRVEFCGSIPRNELISKICKSHIFILNSSFESFSFQLVEAMATGTPVIATRVGNLGEIVENEENGILVAPNDLDMMKKYIKKIMEDDEFRNKISKNAVLRSKDFSIEKTMESLALVLKECFNK